MAKISRARRLKNAVVLKRYGFKNPYTLLYEADKAGISHVTAAALTEQETGTGRNVFGHDPVRNPAPKGGTVTKARYLEYKRNRKAGLGMQGVGPLQLTWWEFQDEADRLGGCWKVRYNYRVGFHHLAALIRQHGWHEGVKRYNGSGPAAENYRRAMKEKHTKWTKRLK